MVDILMTEETKGNNLDNYIVDPEKDGVAAEFVDVDGTPSLEGDPAEFKETEGALITPKEVVKAEENKKAKAGTVVTPKVKENKESKEEEAKRYKKILIDLGFHLKEGGEDGKAQYVMKFGDLGVGRTFQTSYPTGKFWARQNDKFLDASAVKELDIVKAFYAVRDGKKSIKKVAPKIEPTSGEEVIPYEKPAEIKREIGAISLKKKGGYYQVAGHKEPDAALVQQYANDAGVDLKIITAEQDDIGVKAVIQAVLNGQTVDAAVIHHFNTSRDVIALEVIESMQRKRMKPIEGYQADGRPLLSQETNYRIYKRYIRFKNFSLRDAVTKACRIASLKILNKDWRNQEEIESETAEVKSVNRGDNL